MKHRKFINISSYKSGGALLQCEVGIDPLIASITASAVGGQHLSQWCWAACIETVFRYYGYIVPQAFIVERTLGAIVNLPAYPSHIHSNLNGRWVDAYGQRFLVSGDVLLDNDVLSANLVTVAHDLSQDMPLIIGTVIGNIGHAMVLTSLRWLTDVHGKSIVTDAVVRDPCPNVGKRVLSDEEWYSTSFLARIRIFPL
jgi:hypothetical protein